MKLHRALLTIALTVALTSSSVWPMSQSSIPTKFGIPWGNSAGVAYIRAIPQASQIGTQNCAASLTDGFPPLTFTPSASGGCPPFGADFNGILKQITQWSQWQAAGGPVFWDSAFSTSIGGYPKGAIVQSSVLVGRLWLSTADNNATNPDDQTGAAANWIALPGTATAGTPIPGFSTTAPPNAVAANGLTVGNGSSNATGRANADTFWLFVYLWTNCSTCSVFNSAGGGVSRGGSAVADWAANRAVQTIALNGTALMGADTQGSVTASNLSGVPVQSGSRTTPTSVLGENLHSLTSGENGSHTHSYSDPGHVHSQVAPTFAGGAGAGAQGCSGSCLSTALGAAGNTGSAVTSITIQSSGSGTPHNTVERSMLVSWWLAQ